jgi:hypothetical protein
MRKYPLTSETTASATTTSHSTTVTATTAATTRVSVLLPYTMLVFLYFVENLICYPDVLYLRHGRSELVRDWIGNSREDRKRIGCTKKT